MILWKTHVKVYNNLNHPANNTHAAADNNFIAKSYLHLDYVVDQFHWSHFKLNLLKFQTEIFFCARKYLWGKLYMHLQSNILETVPTNIIEKMSFPKAIIRIFFSVKQN